MPIRPRPYTLACRQCHWNRSFSPASDALIAGRDFVSTCPKCGSGKLEHRKVGPIEVATTKLNAWLTRVGH